LLYKHFDNENIKKSINELVENIINETLIKPTQIILCTNEQEIITEHIANIPITIIKKYQNSDIEALDIAAAITQYNNHAGVLCLNYNESSKPISEQHKKHISHMKEKYSFEDKQIELSHKTNKQKNADYNICSGTMITSKKLSKNCAKILGISIYKGPAKASSIAPIFACAKLFHKFNIHPNKVDLFEFNESCEFTQWAFAKAFSAPKEKFNCLTKKSKLKNNQSIIKNLLTSLCGNKDNKTIGIGISNNMHGEALAIALEL
jgi:hypothetical protein